MKKYQKQNNTINMSEIIDLRKKYKCEMCHNDFVTIINLQDHLNISHGIKKFECEKCGKHFTYSKFVVHRKSCCGIQPIKRNKSVNYNLVEPDRYQCTKCEIVLKTKKAINNHFYQNHSLTTFKCDICDKQFPYISKLKLHMAIHNRKPCGKLAKKGSVLIHKENRFRCEKCS